jgi:hypothetical protein
MGEFQELWIKIPFNLNGTSKSNKGILQMQINRILFKIFNEISNWY